MAMIIGFHWNGDSDGDGDGDGDDNGDGDGDGDNVSGGAEKEESRRGILNVNDRLLHISFE